MRHDFGIYILRRIRRIRRKIEFQGLDKAIPELGNAGWGREIPETGKRHGRGDVGHGDMCRPPGTLGKPQSGVRVQPTAQAVGQVREKSQPRSGERCDVFV